MSSNENKYVQVQGRKDEDVRAWRMRVKAHMSKLKIWYVFEKENDNSAKFNEDFENARNEIVSWLGNKFVKSSSSPDVTKCWI